MEKKKKVIRVELIYLFILFSLVFLMYVSHSEGKTYKVYLSENCTLKYDCSKCEENEWYRVVTYDGKEYLCKVITECNFDKERGYHLYGLWYLYPGEQNSISIDVSNVKQIERTKYGSKNN